MNNFESLLSALAGVPVLRGARCRGRHALFDPQRPEEPADVAAARHRQALALCDACPALPGCRTWAAALPIRKRPYGVIAGQLRPEPTRRRKAS
ncbi:MAG: hypothetical protein FGM52_05110 [Mycobacterium sp.]|nr:hypothetical protein [Mycobacterium sp.]